MLTFLRTARFPCVAWVRPVHAGRIAKNSPEEAVPKSDLDEQIEALQDVLTDIREMIYGALEPTDDDADTQVESLRNVLTDIEDMIDSALDPLEDEDDDEVDEDEDEDR